MRKRIIYFYLAVLLLLSFATAKAQRLYDEGREKQAEEAAKLADEILNKTTFENQLKNLDTFAKKDIEFYFRRTKTQMEFRINSFTTWKEVTDHVERVEKALRQGNIISGELVAAIKADLDTDCESGLRTTDFGKEICTAQKELAKMKAEVKTSDGKAEEIDKELKARLEKIDEVQTLVEKAATYFKSDDAAKKAQTVTDITNVFLNMGRSYANFSEKIKSIRNQPLDEMRLILNRVAVESLELEADHWKTIGEIYLRRADEQSDLFRTAKDYRDRFTQIANCLGISEDVLAAQEINEAFNSAQTDFYKASPHDKVCKINAGGQLIQLKTDKMIAYLFLTLYDAAALVARGETPAKLANLRVAHELHRFSIRQSAVVARGYEILLQSGTKRLQRYYAGGIKPEKIAQLIYAAATVAIPAVIAGK